MKTDTTRRSAGAAIGMLATALGTQATPAIADSLNALDEVVVTSTRREEDLQDVPLSLIARSGEELARTGVRSFEDLARAVPSLSYTEVGPGMSVLVIRGVGGNTFNRDDPNNNKATVGVYLDDVPLSVALSTPDIDTFDMTRVEVLRGPQGTLFGAGSLSGTMRFISNQPTNEFEGTIEAGLATTRHGAVSYETKGMVNLPLGETVALRAVGSYSDRGGYIDSFFDGNQRRKDVNDLRKSVARLALAWRPTEALTITPRVMYQRDQTDGSSFDDFYSRNSDSAAGVFAPGATGFVGQPVGNNLEQFRQFEEGLDSKFKLADLNISYDFGPATLVSSSSYIDRDITALRDFQFFWSELGSTPPFLDIGRISHDPPRGIASLLTDTSTVKSFAQELRLVSNSEGPFQWLIGGFALDQTIKYDQLLISPGFGSIFEPGLAALFGVPGVAVQPIIDSLGLGVSDATAYTKQKLELGQLALFSEVTYNITPKWAATVGLRYFHFKEDKNFTFAGFLQGGVDIGQSRYREDGVNPRFILTYKPNEDVLISAQASRGFRPGGTNEKLNPLCGPDLAALGLDGDSGVVVKSDTVWSYELNAKTRLNDGRMTFNVGLFHMKYNDLLASLRLSCGQVIRQNVGDSTSQGVEFELTAQATDHWFFSLGGSYVDAELDSAPPQFPGQKGDRIPQSPKYMLNGLARYSMPVLGGAYQAYVQGSVQAVGDQVSFFYNNASFEPAGNKVDSYALGSLRAGLAGERWDASLWVENITDERVELTIESEFRLSRRSFARNRPRTVGVSVGYRF